MKTKCKKCTYEWETNSDMVLVTCPSCGLKTKKGDTNGEDKKGVRFPKKG